MFRIDEHRLLFLMMQAKCVDIFISNSSNSIYRIFFRFSLRPSIFGPRANLFLFLTHRDAVNLFSSYNQKIFVHLYE